MLFPIIFRVHVPRRVAVASPSRGVVTQAVALGVPVYLFCPRGHVEQEYNLAFYLRFFRGVAAPRTRRYRRYVKGRYIRSRRRNEAPKGWKGELLSLAEWEEKIHNGSYDLTEQALAPPPPIKNPLPGRALRPRRAICFAAGSHAEGVAQQDRSAH